MPGIGRGISPYLKRNASSGPAVPNALITSWYNSLAVKPSNALLIALNTLSAGMDADGDWIETDFLSIIAGMETDEQRLKPLITTSGDDMINLGATLSVNGVKNNGGLCINSKWNPRVDGIKYTVNNCFLGGFCNSTVNSETIKTVLGADATDDDLTFNWGVIEIQMGNSSCNINSTILNWNDGGGVQVRYTNISVSKPAGNTNFPFWASIKRTASNSSNQSLNGSTQAVNATLSTNLPDADLAICGIAEKATTVDPVEYLGQGTNLVRACVAGSSNCDHARIGSRLNTFFQARGLNPYV